jgi:hypothetical protein
LGTAYSAETARKLGGEPGAVKDSSTTNSRKCCALPAAEERIDQLRVQAEGDARMPERSLDAEVASSAVAPA